MKYLGALLLIALLAACNLTTQPVAQAPTETATLEPTPQIILSVTPLTVGGLPTLAPPPIANATLPPGTLCQVYTTYSGSDPNNLLSLRAEPSVTATQLLKLPNNVSVFRIPNSQEIEAGSYHWLNIVYIDPSNQRFQGWTARDSYSKNGVRDPLIATLRATNQQSPC
jgi:hypothetical protein